MPSRKQDVRKISLQQRAEKAIDLRLDGYTYEQIADELQLTDRSHARKVVHGAIKDLPQEKGLRLRRVISARYDKYQRALARKVAAGDVAAVREAVHIEDLRAKLFGIYKPDIEVHARLLAEQDTRALLARLDQLPPDVQAQALTAIVGAARSSEAPAARAADEDGGRAPDEGDGRRQV
jgi:hypothetical protein